jgi:hypothetical protein
MIRRNLRLLKQITLLKRRDHIDHTLKLKLGTGSRKERVEVKRRQSQKLQPSTFIDEVKVC